MKLARSFGCAPARLATVPFLFLALATAQHAVLARQPAAQPQVVAAEAIGMTVSDMDRSVEFFSKALSIEKVSDLEVAGDAYEHLEGVFGLRMRVVRMRLGDEFVELTEYLVPRGKPFPVDSRSNDRWFQHIAIIVSDMDRACQWPRQHKVHHAFTGPLSIADFISPHCP
jgi:catechol 2,3-dioxygenase-like lactoylglutathione lyase family enzyme